MMLSFEDAIRYVGMQIGTVHSRPKCVYLILRNEKQNGDENEPNSMDNQLSEPNLYARPIADDENGLQTKYNRHTLTRWLRYELQGAPHRKTLATKQKRTPEEIQWDGMNQIIKSMDEEEDITETM